MVVSEAGSKSSSALSRSNAPKYPFNAIMNEAKVFSLCAGVRSQSNIKRKPPYHSLMSTDDASPDRSSSAASWYARVNKALKRRVPF